MKEEKIHRQIGKSLNDSIGIPVSNEVKGVCSVRNQSQGLEKCRGLKPIQFKGIGDYRAEPTIEIPGNKFSRIIIHQNFQGLTCSNI